MVQYAFRLGIICAVSMIQEKPKELCRRSYKTTKLIGKNIMGMQLTIEAFYLLSACQILFNYSKPHTGGRSSSFANLFSKAKTIYGEDLPNNIHGTNS